MIAIDPSGIFDYVLEEERDAEDPTVFQLRALTDSELDRAVKTCGKICQTGDITDVRIPDISAVVKAGVEGWRGLRLRGGAELDAQFDEKEGTPLGKPRRVLADSMIQSLPLNVRAELVAAILTHQQPTAEEVGNS